MAYEIGDRGGHNPENTMMKAARFAGVDVSKDSLHAAFEASDGELVELEVPNSVEGRQRLLAEMSRDQDPVHLVLEATGPYSVPLTLAAALHPTVDVMVAQPLATASFAKAILQRAKTDRVDARMLLEFAKRMDFAPTSLMTEEKRKIRTLGRHLGFVIEQRARLKNQVHTHEASGDDILTPFLQQHREALDATVAGLEAKLLQLIQADEQLARLYDRMLRVRGIGHRGAVRLLAEMVAIPVHLTPKQAVAFVGLDPRPNRSGTSKTNPSSPISKRGSSRVRQVLYMMTIAGARFEPSWKRYYERMISRGKPPKVVRVALMRKVFTALWMMWTRDEDFRPEKFTSMP